LITGAVTDERVPVIELELAGGKWRAVIDTGFNGDVELPVQFKKRLKCRYLGRFKSFLAAGKVVREEVFQVEFPFDGDQVSAMATFSPGTEILLGTRLLRNHRLEFDFLAQTVELRRA
jgi:predicted aspartyl protease